VHRCLCTHRICYLPDYRQLAERGLSPRKIHSIVDCSSHSGDHLTTCRRRSVSGEESRTKPRGGVFSCRPVSRPFLATPQGILLWVRTKSGEKLLAHNVLCPHQPRRYLSERTKSTVTVSFLSTVTFFSQLLGSENTGR
jgi:hypothetical protein